MIRWRKREEVVGAGGEGIGWAGGLGLVGGLGGGDGCVGCGGWCDGLRELRRRERRFNGGRRVLVRVGEGGRVLG